MKYICHWAMLAVAVFGLSGVANHAAPPVKAIASDEALRAQVVGVWEDDYQGHRTMTVRADGTATMVVRLSGLKAALYASELTFEMLWSIQDGKMKKKTTGGSPAGKVRLILKAMGDETEERILELSAKRLVLLDRDGERKYDWRRVAAAGKDARPGQATAP